MFQRCHALAIGQVHIGSRPDEQPDDLRVAPAAVAQDDGLQQGGPSKVVDVVHFYIGPEQPLDDPDVAPLITNFHARQCSP